MDEKEAMVRYKNGVVPVPIFTFSGHQTEGFGIDWCPTMSGNKKTVEIQVICLQFMAQKECLTLWCAPVYLLQQIHKLERVQSAVKCADE